MVNTDKATPHKVKSASNVDEDDIDDVLYKVSADSGWNKFHTGQRGDLYDSDDDSSVDMELMDKFTFQKGQEVKSYKQKEKLAGDIDLQRSGKMESFHNSKEDQGSLSHVAASLLRSKGKFESRESGNEVVSGESKEWFKRDEDADGFLQEDLNDEDDGLEVNAPVSQNKYKTPPTVKASLQTVTASGNTQQNDVAFSSSQPYFNEKGDLAEDWQEFKPSVISRTSETERSDSPVSLEEFTGGNPNRADFDEMNDNVTPVVDDDLRMVKSGGAVKDIDPLSTGAATFDGDERMFGDLDTGRTDTTLNTDVLIKG